MPGLTLILVISHDTIFNLIMPEGRFVVSVMTLGSVQYDFQQCIMLHIALGNNVATGYKIII